MTKALDNTVLDAPEAVLDNATRMCICSGAPANFDGIAAVLLAEVTIDSSDFTPADNDGEGGGRMVTVAAQAGITVDEDGTATHLTLDDGTTLLAVTETVSQALTEGNTVNVPAWRVRFRDPV